MRSGEPTPSDELQVLILQRKGTENDSIDVVSSAARWLKAALYGADLPFQYAACGEHGYAGYAIFFIMRSQDDVRLLLEVKLAEIGGKPYAAAEVRTLGHMQGSPFPFFGPITSTSERDLLLHFIADFVASTEPLEGPMTPMT
jgi:hypothetical protein